MDLTHSRLSKQIILICCFFLLCCSLIIARLIYFQLSWGSYFLKQSEKNFIRTEIYPVPRGTIFDCKRTILASNRPITSLIWHGTGQKKLTEQQQTVLNTIEQTLGIPCKYTMADIELHERKGTSILLCAHLSEQQVSLFEELFTQHPNFILQSGFERYYPYKSLASHIVGYVVKQDKNYVGQIGLEKQYDALLQGTNGLIQNTVNAMGNCLEQKTVHPGTPGKNIISTIDSSLQTIAEKVFPSGFSGTCIVMDPVSGALRAVVSRPSFDPMCNDSKTYSYLNRATSACYPPGSIFKLVTMAAALEEGIVTTREQFTCKGSLILGDRTFWCNIPYGHGSLTIGQALAQSCNIPFYEIGKRVSVNSLADYAQRFGLGSLTHINLPEKTGLVPTKEWKELTKHEPWWKGETLSVAIGQSYVLTTPIQIACMIGSIFTGSLVVPRILESEPIQKTSLTIKPSTRSFLQRAMRAVVKNGTGKRINMIDNMEIYAKTSTAQISTKEHRKLSKEYLEHCWFVANFRYKNQSDLVLVILVENAGYSRIPTIAAKDFLIAYKELIDTN